MKTILSVCILFISLQTHAQQDSTGFTNLYFFRSTGFTGSARTFKIFMDGELLCKIKNESYLELQVTPGLHSFAIQMDGENLRARTEKLDLMTEAGKNHYFLCSLVTDMTWSKAQLDELTENSGKNKMKNLEKKICKK